MRNKNIVITVYTLRTIIATASSSLSKFNKIRCGTPTDFSDPRLQLVVDVLMMIADTFKDNADKNRLINFIDYNMSDNKNTFWHNLTEVYQNKLKTDIRSFNHRMRKGGYFVER